MTSDATHFDLNKFIQAMATFHADTGASDAGTHLRSIDPTAHASSGYPCLKFTNQSVHCAGLSRRPACSKALQYDDGKRRRQTQLSTPAFKVSTCYCVSTALQLTEHKSSIAFGGAVIGITEMLRCAKDFKLKARSVTTRLVRLITVAVCRRLPSVQMVTLLS